MADVVSDGLQLQRLFRRFETRAALVLFVRVLSAFMGVAMLTFAMATLGGQSNGSARAAAATAAALLTISAVVTIVRRPGRASVAASIDRGAGLQELVATALELRDKRDPVSALVVREATRRLSAVRASDVFPFRLPRLTSTVVAAVVLVATLIALGRPSLRQWAAFTGAGMNGPGQSTAATASRAQNDAARPPTPPPSTETSLAQQPSAQPSNRGPASGTANRPPDALAGEQRSDSSPNRTSTPPESSGGSNQIASQAGTAPGGSASARAGGGLAPQRSQRQVAGGGIQGESLEGPQRATGSAETSNASYRRAYLDARAAAENPTAQARIPPERRVLVKQDFAAIRPEDR